MNKFHLFDKNLFFKNNRLLYIIFLFVLFPPLPKMFYGYVFKIEFFVILLAFVLSVLKNRKIIIYDWDFVFVWCIVIFSGVFIGALNGNSFFGIVKDCCYFSLPLLVMLLLSQTEGILNKNFYSILFKYANVIAFLQIILGFLSFNVDRYLSRHIFLLFSTGLIPLVLILRVIYVKKIFDFSIFLYLFSLILTKGRGDLLFVLLFFASFLMYRKVKKLKFRLIYIVLLMSGFSIMWMLPLVYPEIQDSMGSSLHWRYTEWRSFFEAVKEGSFYSLLTGRGFGSSLVSLRPLLLFHGPEQITLEKFHSIFIFLIYKLGIMGLMFFGFLISLIFSRVERFQNDACFWLLFFLSYLLSVVSPIYGGFSMSMSHGIIFGFVLFLIQADGCGFCDN